MYTGTRLTTAIHRRLSRFFLRGGGDVCTQAIRSGQFKRFWNWFGKSKCPGARVDLTVNFHHKHFIDLTNCPWVSEDGIFLKEERDRELTISLSSELNILGPEKILKTENCNKSGRSIACESLLNCKTCCAVGMDLKLYTCQLSRLRRESHACGLKTSISRRLTPAGQFLTPD